ncbi:MAG: hypothetical protein M3179_02510 [Actinomycetota bacterium]|nr:hypothetical protein [Actinomycetota bacterium]
MSRLRTLTGAGQSVWLDFLSRPLITSGGLQRLIDDHGVSGVTSNPSIFARAMVGSDDYDAALKDLPQRPHDPLEDFYRLALADIRMAADQLRPTWVRLEGGDGFVSFELEPNLAHDAPASVAAALRLVERIARPNVMIKVPGTVEGVAAVEELTAAGLNVNITLLFTVDRYEAVAGAYLAGLERRLARGLSVGEIASVASFFVSRVDTATSRLLPAGSTLRGRVAVANAKVAYWTFRSLFSGERWRRRGSAPSSGGAPGGGRKRSPRPGRPRNRHGRGGR